MKIAISAAETSGDLIGAKLVSALKAQNSDIQIKGMAGERMFEAGCVQLWDKNLANVMGFSEVLKKLPALLRLQKDFLIFLIRFLRHAHTDGEIKCTVLIP
jgi:lipid-A-disaccharide synthase